MQKDKKKWKRGKKTKHDCETKTMKKDPKKDKKGQRKSKTGQNWDKKDEKKDTAKKTWGKKDYFEMEKGWLMYLVIENHLKVLNKSLKSHEILEVSMNALILSRTS